VPGSWRGEVPHSAGLSLGRSAQSGLPHSVPSQSLVCRNRLSQVIVRLCGDSNRMALAALNVWRRPLPQVLKENIMDPIGASNTWRWFGYENSWIVLDGSAVQSVTGGGHWGGGMYINAYDMARFGYLTLRRGKWKDRQLLSDQWIDQALTPTKPEPIYGYMNWFLNTDRKRWPSAPATAFAHVGNGTNMVYVDPEHDLVAVVRWIDGEAIDGFLKRLLAAIDQG